jgi:hypothetical protein
MSKSNAFETALLELIFNAAAFADIAENDTTSPATNLYVSLHTGDPGEAGNQSTSETTYTGYARVAVARTSGGWTVTGDSVSPAANIDFGAWTAGAGTLTFFGIGVAASGAGVLLYSGAISPTIVLGAGVVPRLTTATTVTED